MSTILVNMESETITSYLPMHIASAWIIGERFNRCQCISVPGQAQCVNITTNDEIVCEHHAQLFEQTMQILDEFDQQVPILPTFSGPQPAAINSTQLSTFPVGNRMPPLHTFQFFSSECCVCYDSINLLAAGCHHVVCYRCLCQNTTCPLCRTPLNINDIRRL